MQKHEQDLNDIYLKDIKKDKYDIIPIEIEQELIKGAKNGNKKSEQQLINAHLRLVVNIAKRYGKRGEELYDLIQEGNLGLYDAIRKYNFSKNVRFCYYAKWWIRKYIVSFLQARNKITNNESYVTDEEYDNAIADYEIETINDNEEKDDTPIVSANKLLDTLDDRMRYVIESIYGLNGVEQRNLIEISKCLDVSPERVRQLKIRAMMILRNNALANNFRMTEKTN